MFLTVTAHLDYALAAPADVLLQIEAAPMPDQRLVRASIGLSPVDNFVRIPGEDGVGERMWMRAQDRLICEYQAVVEVDRPMVDLDRLAAVPLHGLSAAEVRYLFPSRYCPSDEFQSFVTAEFGHLEGGAKIVAMRDWIERSFAYTLGSSTAQTTARDTFVHREGVCRDFAHMLITLARASAIPARMASVFALGVEPQDFHAVAEVWLDGGWHLVDPTGMAQTDQMARIAVGRDAADVSFMTCFGRVEMLAQNVWAEQSAGN